MCYGVNSGMDQREDETMNRVNYFYVINSNGSLLGGVTRSYGGVMRKFPVWKSKKNFNLAMRFTTVESAVQYIETYNIPDASVINEYGTIVYNHSNRPLEKGGFDI